jgi:glycosyltransferase involved in cell wall biosynthesis
MRGTLAPPELISVIIPVLNGEEHLGEQLDALAAQTYRRPWEILIVDNGCTDGTLSVVERCRDRLPPLRVADATATKGINHARNVGVAAACGDFLAFCDADDIVTPGWLEALAGAATSADVVDGIVDLEALNRPALLPLPPDGKYGGLPLKHDFLPSVSGGNCGMWRFVADELGWNEDFTFGSSDIEFAWRAALASYTLEAAPEAIVLKRPRRRLRSIARQWWSYGESDAQLYRHFRHVGMPRRSTAEALREWRRLARRCRDLVRSPQRRAAWITDAARCGGRVRGSIRYRVLFL